MTERPDAARHRWSPRSGPDADADPTGVRTILSSLPDPAPMPEELAQRIAASLAREEALRHEAQQLGTVHALAADRADASQRGGRRHGFGRRLPAIAVAASIVVLAGAVIMGVLTMTGGLAGGGSDTSAGAVLNSDGREQAEGSSELDESHEDAQDLPSAAAAPSDEAYSLATAAEPFVLTTGTTVTAGTLAAHARALRAHTAVAPDENAAQRLSASALRTPSGVADCLAGVLTQPAADLEPRLDAIDVVEFAGTTAVLVLLADAPGGAGDPGEPVTAYLVPLTCRAENAVTLHDPVRVG